MSDRLSLNISRTIEATRSKVFAAWVKPEFMALWFAPPPMLVAQVNADARPGGAYAITMKGADNEVTVSGQYQEVVEDERLVFTWSWAGDPNPVSLVTVEFSDVPEGTQVLLRHERLASVDAVEKHTAGWQACLDSLLQNRNRWDR